jgi:hypothetical protein
MPALIANRFSSYEFSEQEFKSAVVFNPLQKMYLQTEASKIAESILNLDCAEKKDLDNFEVQRAYLKGQMEIIEHLLNASSTMELNIQEEAAESSKDATVIFNNPSSDGNIFGHGNFNTDESGV